MKRILCRQVRAQHLEEPLRTEPFAEKAAARLLALSHLLFSRVTFAQFDGARDRPVTQVHCSVSRRGRRSHRGS